jgi:hypothetical protein
LATAAHVTVIVLMPVPVGDDDFAGDRDDEAALAGRRCVDEFFVEPDGRVGVAFVEKAID